MGRPGPMGTPGGIAVRERYRERSGQKARYPALRCKAFGRFLAGIHRARLDASSIGVTKYALLKMLGRNCTLVNVEGKQF